MANSNPLVAQGTLNRLRASVIWANFPQLNVTAPFLHKEGISLALEGDVTTYIDTMTGGVTSPEPYQRANLTLTLLKTQPLSALYKQQLELSSLLGNGTVRPDSSTLPPYALVNCAIRSVRELRFSGEDAAWAVSVGGYYLVNSNLFS
jgi:hypothetical protein